MLKSLATFAAAVALTGAAFAADKEAPFVPPSTVEELDARIAEAFAKSKIVGMQIALVDETGASWAKSYGFLDKEKSRLVENDSVFRAGSISKSFTGVLAQMLVEDGVIDLQQRLREAAPDIEFTNRWEETDPVLLADLAEHTTGWDDIQLSEYRDFGPGTTLADGIAFNPISRTSRWRPGRYVSYNNVGPAILARIMEMRTGKSYETLIDERIIGPLGMDNASFLPTDAVMAKISGSFSVKGQIEPYANIGVRPAGSLNTSATELAKFAALLIRRGEWNGATLLSPESVDRIERPTRSLAARAGLKMGYGLGVYQTQTNNYGVYSGHTGGIDGFVAEYGHFSDSRTGFVVMLNTPDGENMLAIRKLMIAYLRREHSTKPAAPAAGVDLSQYEGLYRQITPRMEFIRVATDILDIARVEAKDGGLLVSPPFGEGVTLTALGDGLFVAEGLQQADRVVILSPEGKMEMIRALQNAYRRVSAFDWYWRFGLVAFVALGLAIAAVSLLLWVVLRPFGVFRGSNRWRVWALPTLAIASLAGAGAAGVLGSSGSGADSIEKLGAATPWSLAIAFGTVGLAIFSALGLVAAPLAPGASRGARIGAGFCAAGLSAFALYLLFYGWIGMTVWSYRPTVVGL